MSVKNGEDSKRCRLTRSIWLVHGLFAMSVMTIFGCRTPWHKALNSEPNFDRLIEIERQSADASPSRDSLASRHRPGSSSGSKSRKFARKLGSVSEDAEDIDVEDELEFREALALTPEPIRGTLLRQRQAMADRAARKQAEARSGVSGSISDSEDGDVEEAVTFHLNDSDETPALESAGPKDSQFAKQSASEPSRQAAPPTGADKSMVRTASGTSRDQDSGVISNLTDEPQSHAAHPVVTSAHEELRDAPRQQDRLAEQTDWQDHIHQAISQLSGADEVAANPEEQMRLAVVKRLLSLSVGDVNSAVERVDGLQPHEQDYFVHQLHALHDAIDPEGNPVLSRRWTLVMLNQRKALGHLSAVSNLEIHNIALCTEVDSFGVISKFPQYHFRPDQELLLYCELDNFVSEPVKDGFETQLQGSYEIVDSGGRRVADQLLPMDSHVCRNQRRDYFIAYRIYMPQSIEPGRYQLKLTIEDMKGRKFGQSSVDFQVVN